MPDDRLFHKRLGHSRKVNALTDFEFRVWVQFELSADDCGVLRYAPIALQADNDTLAARKNAVVKRAMDRLVEVGLVLPFEHQGERYLCQPDWQNFQRVRFPRPTLNPIPPSDVLHRCSPETVALLRSRHGGRSEDAPSDNGATTEDTRSEHGASSEDAPSHLGDGSVIRARANGRRLTAVTDGSGNGSSRALVDPALGERGRRFLERYSELFYELRKGARYYAKPALDFPEALRLCQTWDDDRLESLARAFLSTDDKFCRQGSGSVAHFASRASWCDAKLKESGL